MKYAIILAGGKGERLRPYTEDRPKCMIEVQGKPIMEHQLVWLRSHGIRHIVVSCGYKHDVIMRHFGDGSRFDVTIEYAVEAQPLGRGGGLKQALKRIKRTSEPIVVINGDLISDIDLNDVLNFHLHHRPAVTLVTVPLKSPYGIVECFQDQTVRQFHEKPELPFWINAGIYLMDASVIALLPDVGDHEEETFPVLAASNSLKAWRTRSFWRTVDTAKDLSELHQDLKKQAVASPVHLKAVSAA